jgi:hypothetical protein
MQSDTERLRLAQAALERGTETYRAALARAAGEVQAWLAAQRSAAAPKKERMAAELGPFGAGRIDVERLASAFADSPAPDAAALETIEAAAAVLRGLADSPADLVVTVQPGESLGEAVGTALARLGRAFGAVHLIALARAGRSGEADRGAWLHAYPFVRWSRRERQIAPPLVVSLDGAQLAAGSLAEFLDGSLKLALLVREPAPPAPLVRLITPGVFVGQSHDGSELSRLAAWGGPGVLAWMPESAARFVHDPAANPNDHLTIAHLPGPPRKAVGGSSVTQQVEELRQLQTLAANSVAVLAREAGPAGAGAGETANPVDRLASWLLSQADLSNL